MRGLAERGRKPETRASGQGSVEQALHRAVSLFTQELAVEPNLRDVDFVEQVFQFQSMEEIGVVDPTLVLDRGPMSAFLDFTNGLEG